jgi:hypothetical protein
LSKSDILLSMSSSISDGLFVSAVLVMSVSPSSLRLNRLYVSASVMLSVSLSVERSLSCRDQVMTRQRERWQTIGGRRRSVGRTTDSYENSKTGESVQSMVMGGFRERDCGSEGESKRRGFMEREDEEGPDGGRWRCLSVIWTVGRRVAVFWGSALLGLEMENREEDR